MLVLGLDTSLNAASVCIWNSAIGSCSAWESTEMARGHDETLVLMIERAARQSHIALRDLDRIAVTVGPGSFTGLRIGLAAARAFGLALNRPVAGVSTLAALAASEVGSGQGANILASIEGRNGRVFAQIFDARGRSLRPPTLAEPDRIVAEFGAETARLVGPGASLLATQLRSLGRQTALADKTSYPDVAMVARLGALAEISPSNLRPLYIEAAAVTLAPADPAARAVSAPRA